MPKAFGELIIPILQISFAIRLENPGRIGMLVTVLLCLVNIYISVTASSPKSHGYSSIAIWLLFHIIFVFVILVEYGIIVYLKNNCWRNTDNNVELYFQKVDQISLFAALFILFVFMIVFSKMDWGKIKPLNFSPTCSTNSSC